MSSPPAAPRPKIGQRRLLGGPFSRPRLQSGSQSHQRPNAGVSSPPAESTEGTGLTSSSISGTSTILEGLNPAKQATYDSSLAIDVNRRSCTQGTRVGVLNSLEAWLHNPASPSIYWIDGAAGTGKTTIANTFCELGDKRKFLAASFFCSRNSAESRKVTRIVPTIAYQLSHHSISYRSALGKVLEQNVDVGSKNMLRQFELLLKGPLREVQDTMPECSLVVIDGLDECEDRNGAELVLDTLLHFAPECPLKFLVTSRPAPEIDAKMSLHSQWSNVLHLDGIEKSLVEADIERYLKEELRSISPTQAQIEQLIQRSETFFIYAATLVRYITSSRRSDPYKRLRSILDVAHDPIKRQNPVDALYMVVLESAMGAGERDDIWTVLHVVLLAQEPVNISTIVALAGVEDPQRVLSAISLLRSVVNHPRATGLVSTFHASFADFIFNERAGQYYCDPAKLSEVQAQRCFLVMKEQLRFNICDLETSFFTNDKIENMQARISSMISSGLAYICRYWVNYLSSSLSTRNLLRMLDEFLSNRLLSWMEVMSLRRDMVVGIEGLLRTKQWLDKKGNISANLVLLVEDARNFVTGFAACPASQSTPHIYISSLPFCPRSSLVYKNYRKRTQGILELNGSLMENRETVALATWTLSSNILSIACSSQGDRVAVGCFDKTVRILNAYDGLELVGPLRGHTELTHSVAFSPDGRLVASGSYDGTVRVWNADNGIPICVTHSAELDGHICHINSVSFSPNARHVVSGSAVGIIRVWDANNGALLLGPLKGHTDWIRSVAFSPDGALIASASDDRTIRLWNAHDGTPAFSPFEGHAHWVMSIAFSPDGTRLASGSRDQTVRVWNIPDGSLISGPFEGHKGPIHSVVVSPDGTRVASGSGDGSVRVWNIYDGTLAAGPFKLVDYSGSTLLVTSVAFSFDGTRVISSSYNRAIHVWDVRYGNDILPPSPQFQNPIASITSLAFSPENTRILSSSTDNIIRLWDARNGSFTIGPGKGQLPSTSIKRFSPVFSPNGLYFAGSFEGGTLQIMSIEDSAVVASPSGVNDILSAFRFSQDSSAVIIGNREGAIQLWDLKTGQVIGNTFEGHVGAVTSIAQSFDCSLLASYSNEDKTLRVWDMLAPALDFDHEPSSASDPAPGQGRTTMHKGWRVDRDGWVVDDNNHLILWLPADIAPVWRSPYASLIVTERGTLHIPKQKISVGSQWTKCYTS